ncbi:MAG: PD-(D/E)XK nuclease family protein [Chloroflexi bacterium]|nr:PD-(D/E)XK nuclease family protein [Chloroflexota bacterium]
MVTLGEAKEFLVQARVLAKSPAVASLSECETFFSRGRALLSPEFPDHTALARAFFDQAELLIRAAPSVCLSERCRMFLDAAKALVQVSTVANLSEYQAFFSRGRALISSEFPDHIAPARALFDQARRFIDVSSPLEAHRSFLKEARQSLLRDLRQRMVLLQHHDPRQRADFIRTNLFDVLAVGRTEGAHSAFLGWLLNPGGSHSLGQAFLQAFLKLAQQTLERPFPQELEGVTVELERGSEQGVPDIVVMGTDFMLVIENKLLGAEGEQQTRRYADDAEREANERNIPTDHLLLMFLTPRGTPPRDPRFYPLSYPQVLEVLEPLLGEEGIPPMTAVALRQFIFNVRANILHLYDLDRQVTECLEQYAREGDAFLAQAWSKIRAVSDKLMKEE